MSFLSIQQRKKASPFKRLEIRGCKIWHCKISKNIRKQEKSQAHKKLLEKAFVNKYDGEDINGDRLKDILNKRSQEHVETFTNFTIIFWWKVNKIEYSITIVKEEVPDSVSYQESLDRIMKKVINRIDIEKFQEITLMFLSDIDN